MPRHVMDERPKPRPRIIASRVIRPNNAATLRKSFDIVVVVAECNIKSSVARRCHLALPTRADRSQLDFPTVETKDHCHTLECRGHLASSPAIAGNKRRQPIQRLITPIPPTPLGGAAVRGNNLIHMLMGQWSVAAPPPCAGIACPHSGGAPGKTCRPLGQGKASLASGGIPTATARRGIGSSHHQ